MIKSNIKNYRQGAPNWPTGSGKGCTPRVWGAPVNFLKISFFIRALLLWENAAMEEMGWGKNKTVLEVTNLVDSQPHECQPTGMPTAHAKTTSLHVYPLTQTLQLLLKLNILIKLIMISEDTTSIFIPCNFDNLYVLFGIPCTVNVSSKNLLLDIMKIAITQDIN